MSIETIAQEMIRIGYEENKYAWHYIGEGVAEDLFELAGKRAYNEAREINFDLIKCLEDLISEAEAFLQKEKRCDIPACNCGGSHPTNAFFVIKNAKQAIAKARCESMSLVTSEQKSE